MLVNKKIPSLDGWRAVAIIIVFVSHAGLGHVVPGGLGVTIFFFLSGYLITTLLFEEHCANRTINIRLFYIRRFLRLSPPLLLVMSFSYLLTSFEITLGRVSAPGFLSQIFYFANYYALYFDSGNTTPVGTGVFWSLAVEEHFYIVFPVFFLVFIRRFKPNEMFFMLLAMCFLILLWRIFLSIYTPYASNRIYYASDTRIDSIIYGCMLAVFCKNTKWANAIDNRVSGIALVILGALSIIVSLVFRDDFFRNTFRYSIQGLALFPLFFYSIRHPDWLVFRCLNNRLVMKVGIYSYVVYLVHRILIENLLVILPNMLVVALLSGLFSLLIASMVDRCIDAPLRPLRGRMH